MVRRRKALGLTLGRSPGDWRVVILGVVVFLASIGLAFAVCGAAFFAVVGIALVFVGFLMSGPRASRPQVPAYVPPTEQPAPQSCLTCGCELAWVPRIGRWSCPGCRAYV